MRKTLAMLSLYIATVISPLTIAETPLVSQFNEWQKVENKGDLGPVNSKAQSSHQVSANIAALTQILLTNQDSVIVTLPLPEGNFADFILTPSFIAESDLYSKYPNIRTFTGHELHNPDNHGSFDITPQGFHGMFKYGKETVFIDPQYRHNKTHYTSYFRKNAVPIDPTNMPKKLPPIVDMPPQTLNKHTPISMSENNETSLIPPKTYRIAITAAYQYTNFFGGKVNAIGAIFTLLNRINQVYQAELGIMLILIADNDLLIYTDPITNPYKTADTKVNINLVNENIIKFVDQEDFDIGHLVQLGNGGLASVGSKCVGKAKSRGVTGLNDPTGDAFHIDFVAHELGHQFGAHHSFNGLQGNCGTRKATSAYEPGSGSTIMAYAGICDEQDLQPHATPIFHSHSIEQIKTEQLRDDYYSRLFGSCGTVSTTNNSLPQVNAGDDYTIPARTAFVLTGSATDADKDTLTYLWEQHDLGAASNGPDEMFDNGDRPLFRVWEPTQDPSRTFPRIEDLLKGKLSLGEAITLTGRELNFRLIVRDGKLGGVSRDEMRVQVVDTGEAFEVIEPSVGSTWTTAPQVVIWQVANTNAEPISCSKVNIQLSTDGGTRFDTDLAMGINNDGGHEFTAPKMTSKTARIKISCADNIFFAINKGNFAIATADTGGGGSSGGGLGFWLLSLIPLHLGRCLKKRH